MGPFSYWPEKEIFQLFFFPRWSLVGCWTRPLVQLEDCYFYLLLKFFILFPHLVDKGILVFYGINYSSKGSRWSSMWLNVTPQDLNQVVRAFGAVRVPWQWRFLGEIILALILSCWELVNKIITRGKPRDILYEIGSKIKNRRQLVAFREVSCLQKRMRIIKYLITSNIPSCPIYSALA